MNRRRNAILAVALLVAVVVAGAVFSHRTSNALAVREIVVHEAAFTTKLPESGVVQLPRTVTIPAGVSGNVGTIAVRAGDRVTTGRLLATVVNDQIASNLRDADQNVAAATGKARSVAEANALLPQQNRSSVVQAEAAVETARSQLTQAQQDLVAGSQSGLGYGGQTAEGQRLAADASLSKADTDLREAKRTYDANLDLYRQKGLSRDALLQSQARFEQARVTADQARRERSILGGTLTRETQVLRDRVRSAQDGLRQAQAALAAARATATQSKAGDLQAASADAERARADAAYARDQAAKLELRAPFDGTIESVAAQSGDSLRPIQPGDAVTAGQALFTMAANGRFIVRTKVDEQDVASVALGQRAIVSGEDFGGAKLPGRVVAISPVAQRSDDPSNTSRQVVTTIELERTLPFLRDGLTVDVDIITHDERRALAVPIDALRKDARGDFVYIVRDGRTHRASVKLGPQNDSQAVVRAGLAGGDTIVAEKNPDVVADASVTPAPEPSGGPSAGPRAGS